VPFRAAKMRGALSKAEVNYDYDHLGQVFLYKKAKSGFTN